MGGVYEGKVKWAKGKGYLSNLLIVETSNACTSFTLFTGAIPTTLGNLSELTVLYLAQNQLTGSIPTELGNLANLQQLHLWTNQLTGAIPTTLGNLSKLTGLYLDNNQLTGTIPTTLGNLSNLQELNFHNNKLTGTIPTTLGNLSNLQSLSLSNNQLTGLIPASLGQIASLQELYLQNNRLSGTIPTTITNRTWTGLNLENPPYVANEIADQVITTNSPFNLNVSSAFADLNSDTITYSITGLPEGLTFDATTKVISGQATTNGTYNVTITGTDNDGNDTLSGGLGQDVFRFDSFTEGLDRITDFNVVDDTIEVSASGFGGGLTVGTLLESQFTRGLSASTEDHRFIYNSSNGQLFFDADGNGTTSSAVQIATLNRGLAMTNTDIVVI